ncbi:MAG: type II toxin-antitoxin system HicB family antitoxin [Actinomycetota bacterium]|nr:type II toxin-antitoxin system HicB family antitoxin [Actinomycetota bacterium]
MDKQYEIQVLIRKDETGYWATVAELPGVFAAGRTRAELLECLDEAIRLYLDETGVPPELADPPIRVEKFNLNEGGLVPA